MLPIRIFSLFLHMYTFEKLIVRLVLYTNLIYPFYINLRNKEQKKNYEKPIVSFSYNIMRHHVFYFLMSSFPNI